jgi:hypothetical protein
MCLTSSTFFAINKFMIMAIFDLGNKKQPVNLHKSFKYIEK